MNVLTDFFEAPKGDASKVMCFLAGGRYDGDRASIVAPAPELMAVSPCDGSCRTEADYAAGLKVWQTCGQPTHWHDVSRGDELGDVPRHAAYYVLVRTEPARSGMRAALYANAGHERPTRRAMREAVSNFERTLRARARRAGVQSPRPERG